MSTPPLLADVLAGAADVLGVPAMHGRGEWLAGRLDAVRHVVVLLVDGLGAAQLDEHAALAPTLCSLPDLGPITVPFPSTTSVSLTSLGTGLPVGMHGIVSSSFLLDDGSVLSPLSWRADPNPIATQPEPTVLELAESAGVVVTSAAPAQHRDSGLTRAALRGGSYPGADTAEARVDVADAAIRRARARGGRSLTYAYWPELDKAGHVHGVRSEQYAEQLRLVDRLVAGLVGLAGADVAVLVTADHGLVDVPDDRRVDLDADPALRRGVRTILGEPRARHVYVQPGAAAEVARTWTRVMGDRASVLTRAQACDLMGPVDEWYLDRVGDVVAVANEDWALVSDRVDRVVSGLRGQHGGLTGAEVLVPLRLAHS